MSLVGDVARGEDEAQGQRYDRIQDGAVYMPSDLPDDDIPEPEISIGQKMLSAVSGSILTSLLGTATV